MNRCRLVFLFVRFIVSLLVFCILIERVICRSVIGRCGLCSVLMRFMIRIICCNCWSCNLSLSILISVWLIRLVKCGWCIIIRFWKIRCVSWIGKFIVLRWCFGIYMGISGLGYFCWMLFCKSLILIL